MKKLQEDKRFSSVKNRSKDISILYKLIEKNVKNKKATPCHFRRWPKDHGTLV